MEDFFEYYWLKILLLSKYLLLFFSIIYRLKPTIKIVLKNASAFKENVYLIILDPYSIQRSDIRRPISTSHVELARSPSFIGPHKVKLGLNL